MKRHDTPSPVTVAIPTLNGGARIAETLAAVRAQRTNRPLELLVCDSGSSDQTVAVARRHGARVIEIAPTEFSHGGTRNLLMSKAVGSHVAFLTQDAVPAHPGWLSQLLSGFELGSDVGLVFGPYRPRPGASPSVAHELDAWFGSFSPCGRPRIDRLAGEERDLPARTLLGRRGFFTDANGCVARWAWERFPFRGVAYAEDHHLAHDMLRGGLAKVFMPSAPVIHSHEYTPLQWLQRSFDEARAIHQIYGWAEPASPRILARNLRGRVGGDWRWIRAHGGVEDFRHGVGALSASAAHHVLRVSGALLGARADRLPSRLVRRLSLESRGG